MALENVKNNENRRRIPKIGVMTTLLGFLVFLMGASPELFRLDRSPVVGFVQITVFLVGLAMICLGGYASMKSLWRGRDLTIAADIGLRLVATGYVIAVTSGMADVFGFGNQPWPEIPVFGQWQSRGVLLGEIVIAAGFLLMLPPSDSKKRP